MIRYIQIIAAIGVIVASSAHAQSHGSTMQSDQRNQVVIEYVRPQNPDLQDVYETLKIIHALEKIQKILNPLRLPEELTIKSAECGRVNAWYRREESRPTVTICYELLKHLRENLPSETNAGGIEPNDAKMGQFLWITLHEVGHAAFDIFKIPMFENEENAADNFATYVMLQFIEARRLIVGAAWAWREYLQDYKRNPIVQVRLAGFATDHGLPQQRVYNLLCLAYGSNPVRFADFVRDDYLPRIRASHCESEYRTLANAFEKEIAPHIDYKLAKGVIEANWLAGPILRSESQK